MLPSLKADGLLLSSPVFFNQDDHLDAGKYFEQESCGDIGSWFITVERQARVGCLRNAPQAMVSYEHTYQNICQWPTRVAPNRLEILDRQQSGMEADRLAGEGGVGREITPFETGSRNRSHNHSCSKTRYGAEGQQG